MIVNILRTLLLVGAALALAALLAGNMAAFSLILGATVGVMIQLSRAASRRDDARRAAEQAK
jgi:hypothetical protein